jgi:hypothetical protein
MDTAPAHAGSVASGANSVSMETYKALVDRCAKGKVDCLISNGSADHARILIEKLFEIAQTEICLATGKLTVRNKSGSLIYGFPDLMRQAQSFLSNPLTALNVLVNSGVIDQGSENEFLKTIIDDPSRNGIVRVYKPTIGEIEPEMPHFMVADGAAYRLETSADAIGKIDPESITAVANFGDCTVARRLKNGFFQITDWLGSDVATVYKPGAKFSD